MKLNLNYQGAVAWDMFAYTTNTYENGIRYEVRYGGVGNTQARARNGILLGSIARYADTHREWYATPDQGEDTTLRWYGRFTSRAEAAVFLLGARFEQDLPATHNQQRLLRDRPQRVPNPELPASRRCEVTFRRNVPKEASGFEILHVHHWTPGREGGYAYAIAVTRDNTPNGTFCVHNLYWADDNPNKPWYVAEGQYDLPSFEHAHQRAAMLAAELSQ